MIKYHLETYTGSKVDAGTSANVYAIIFAENNTRSGKLRLKTSFNNEVKFLAGEVMFLCSCWLNDMFDEISCRLCIFNL